MGLSLPWEPELFDLLRQPLLPLDSFLRDRLLPLPAEDLLV